MRLHLCAMVALLVGCTAPPSSPEVPEWPVASTPSLTIGSDDARPGHDLSKVTGARMQQGVIVVANSGSNELQRFDSTGKLLGIEGRRGNGPGEFTGNIGLSPAPGDSLYVFDNENLRWSIHDASGHYGRTLTGGAQALARPVLLYHRAMVRTAAGALVPAWMLALLDSLPESVPGSPARQARVDDLGFLWIQDSGSNGAWNVYAGGGAPVGRVALPAGFDLFQEGRDFVLGRALDSADQETVRVYHVARPTGLDVAPAQPSGAVPTSDAASKSGMFADINGIMTAQEMFYANHGAYTSNGDSLGARLSSGAELVLTAGDKRHWAGILYHRASRTTCGVSVGFPSPEGWLDGTAFCGR